MSEITNTSYSVPGFCANGISAGIKEEGKRDLSLIYSKVPAKVAGVFTTNCFKAAPVLLDMKRVQSGAAQAIITNSGNANAATGDEGYKDAVDIARTTAGELGIDEELVLVASTGIIGHRLPVEKIMTGVKFLVSGLSEHGFMDAEEAIMTTDRFPKIFSRQAEIGGKTITVTGMAKGAGMIEPHMATMLAFVMTDAAIEQKVLTRVFKRAVESSFNSITVDGCMSTNDTAIIMANGFAGNRLIGERSRDIGLFERILSAIMSDLAVAMVKDGEGATKVIEFLVEQARSKPEARKIASAIANSNLVKTAFFGQDPNWGRIISAAGAVGVSLPVSDVELYFEDVLLFAKGQGLTPETDIISAVMKKDQIRVCLRLKMGKSSWRIYASDLTFDYVKINAHYHT